MEQRGVIKFLIRFFFIAAFLFSFGISKAYSERIKIAVDESNDPFMYKNKDTGEADGLYPTIVKALFDKIGVDVSVVAYPWKRVMLLSGKGSVGAAGIYKNSERILIYDYSDSIFDERVVVFMRADHAFPFQTVEDLKGKRVGVVRGWSYGDTFDTARKQSLFVVEDSVSDELNFRKLDLGRLDCVIAIDLSGELVFKKLEFKNEIIASNVPMLMISTHIAFSKESNKRDLIQKLNHAIAELKAEDAYKDMIGSAFEDIH